MAAATKVVEESQSKFGHGMDSEDSKAELFRKYLEDHGVMDTWTTALKELYEMEPRPNDPKAILSEKLAQKRFDKVNNMALKAANEDLRVKLLACETDKRVIEKERDALQIRISELERRLACLTPDAVQ